MWDNLNTDRGVATPDMVSPGPRLGFLGKLEAAYEADARAASLDGLAWYFAKQDEAQEHAARQAGEKYTPMYKRVAPPLDGISGALYTAANPMQSYLRSRSGWAAYRDMARAIVDREDNYTSPLMMEQDAEIEAINNRRTDGVRLKTMREMFSATAQEAREATFRESLPSTFMGHLGGFVGSIAAGVDPRVNPLNAATLPVGGGGATIGARIATQALAQGGIEAINQVTGTQENRRLLGLDYGTAHALWNVAGAAVGGAAIQGVGEGVGAAWRRYVKPRWFTDEGAPEYQGPPSPPPRQGPPELQGPQLERFGPPERQGPPEMQGPRMVRGEPLIDAPLLDEAMYGSPLMRGRAGEPRVLSDMDHVRTALEDWHGPAPWEIPPPTMTRVPGGEPIDLSFRMEGLERNSTEGLDSIARRVDPDAFRLYDRLVETRNRFRAWIEDLKTPRAEAAVKATADLDKQIAEVERKLQRASAKNKKKLTAELETLTAERDAMRGGIESRDTPDMAKVRDDLMRVDEDMRDLAPVISRAYSAAQGKWEAYQVQRAQIDDMMAQGRPGIEGLPPRGVNLGETPAELTTIVAKRDATKRVLDIDDELHDLYKKRPRNADRKAAHEAAIAKLEGEREKIVETLERSEKSSPRRQEEPPIAGIDQRTLGPNETVMSAAIKQNVEIEKMQKEVIEKFQASTKQYLPDEGDTIKPREIDSEELRKRFTGKDGQFDANAMEAFLRKEVQDALARGDTVNIVVEGKPHRIVEVATLGLRDTDGNPWGTLPLVMTKPGERKYIEIIPKDAVQTTMTLRVNGRDVTLQLDGDKVVVPNLDGEGERAITVRQLMKEMEHDNQMLQAVNSCSLPATS